MTETAPDLAESPASGDGSKLVPRKNLKRQHRDI
jgi:hypothetical protein